MIEPYRNSPARHIQIRPTLPYQENSLTFDIKSLDFLLLPKSAQVMLDLILEEARYSEAIKSINARSQHHFTVVQPKLADSGMAEGRDYSGQDFLKALGELDYRILSRLTDSVVIHVDRTVNTLASMKNLLRKTLVEKYPKGEFVNFELLNEPPKSVFA
jgi:hypothetical protein